MPLVLGLALVPSAAPGQTPSTPRSSPTPLRSSPTPPPAPVRVYTNDDLDRVRPYRDETGARSVPAFEVSESLSVSERSRRGSARSPRARNGEQGETYWRREAEKVRARVRRLEDERDGLRARLDQRRDDERRVLRRERGTRASDTSSRQQLEARIAILERRMRELEEDLADRARVAGALPGWLR